MSFKINTKNTTQEMPDFAEAPFVATRKASSTPRRARPAFKVATSTPGVFQNDPVYATLNPSGSKRFAGSTPHGVNFTTDSDPFGAKRFARSTPSREKAFGISSFSSNSFAQYDTSPNFRCNLSNRFKNTNPRVDTPRYGVTTAYRAEGSIKLNPVHVPHRQARRSRGLFSERDVDSLRECFGDLVMVEATPPLFGGGGGTPPLFGGGGGSDVAAMASTANASSGTRSVTFATEETWRTSIPTTYSTEDDENEKVPSSDEEDQIENPPAYSPPAALTPLRFAKESFSPPPPPPPTPQTPATSDGGSVAALGRFETQVFSPKLKEQVTVKRSARLSGQFD